MLFKGKAITHVGSVLLCCGSQSGWWSHNHLLMLPALSGHRAHTMKGVSFTDQSVVLGLYALMRIQKVVAAVWCVSHKVNTSNPKTTKHLAHKILRQKALHWFQRKYLVPCWIAPMSYRQRSLAEHTLL